MVKLLFTAVWLLTLALSSSWPVGEEVKSNRYEVHEEDYEDDDLSIDLSYLDKSLHGDPDMESGKALARWSPNESVNPEELGSYLEGDILIPSSETRNGLISQSSRWPDALVPFEIRGSFNAYDMQMIEQGMKEYHAKTCIRFVPRTRERDYVSIVNGNSGCWSSVGKIGGRQELNLQTPGCLTKVGTFVHEMMHAIGFLHEQNRYERDNYVTIMWDNIQSSTRNNFDKASASTTNAFGVDYDFGSVMHYSANAFSRNGQPTIVARNSAATRNMGQRDGFSRGDIQKINEMYRCNRQSSWGGSNQGGSNQGGSNQGGSFLGGLGGSGFGGSSSSGGGGSGAGVGGAGNARPTRRPRPGLIGNPITNLINFFSGLAGGGFSNDEIVQGLNATMTEQTENNV